ncbi:TonB-dependent receptor plug domain-containing protein [Acidicapsa ligni]|uniref:TonB-dependent receptor plug domain-containing protein n=1 Tax=Acidicapsa ligni TaxID=542300 RepID=UPI0021DF9165|nr:TonB-dependent receptor [Acidicapsa ligni]
MTLRNPIRFTLALLLAAGVRVCAAQDTPAPQPEVASHPVLTQPVLLPHPAETMVVLGSPVPVPLAESPSAVLVLPLRQNELFLATPLDPLRSDSSIFLEQRGAGGAQTDVTLRGGSYEQTLVLLNGFRINDSQAAHHNLDLPVPLTAMDSIQVLHGAGSTLHGADALSGVVDFITAAPKANSIEVNSGFGSFGSNEQALTAELLRHAWSDRLTGSHNLSTGFITDRDYRNETAANESWLGSRLGLSDLLLATSDRSFGAAGFYGDYPSWERTKGWFAGLRQELGSETQAAFAYRRHTDDYVLIRTDPAVYENNHIDSSWQGSLRRTISFAGSSVVLAGLEADGDSINSNNLGQHARNRGAGYFDIDLRPTKSRWNLSAGVREEGFSGGQFVASPHLAGSLRIANAFKIRASGGYGYRIPTYTDLYYSDPTTIGNPNLKAESAWTGDGGVDWNANSRLSLSITGFYSRQHDAIDFVRATPELPWAAVNLSGLHFGGVESSATWLATKRQTIRIAWTSLVGAQDALHGLQSEYVFNYPVQNAHFEWTSVVGHWFTVRNSLQVAQRYQQTAYPVWDVSFTHESDAHDTMRIRPYLRLANLSNTGYQEIVGVAMPGRSITGGVSIRLGN